MLVVTRVTGERVVIGKPPIGTVEIVAVSGNQVRLGFDFPKHIRIERERLADDRRDVRKPREVE